MNADIRGILATHVKLNVAVSSLKDGDDLFGAGMSSLASIDLMMALEDHFQIEFPNEMLNRHTFESVSAIANAIGSLVPSAWSPEGTSLS